MVLGSKAVLDRYPRLQIRRGFSTGVLAINAASKQRCPNTTIYRIETKMAKSSEPKNAYDVVVVGAGLSGLQAAQSIQAAGFKVCVLEAIDRVGGKTLTAKSCEKGFNDLGASWINDTNQSEMFKLYQRYGLETETQRACGDTLIQSTEGDVVKVPYGQLPVCLCPSMKLK